MFVFTLQDWLTLRVNPSIGTIAQGANGWLALPEFQDALFWMDFRGVKPGGASSVPVLSYETAPLAEDGLFLPMTTRSLSANAAGGSFVTSVLLNTPSTYTTPLATWVRWSLKATATPTSTWGATFRIRVAANATSKYYLRA